MNKPKFLDYREWMQSHDMESDDPDEENEYYICEKCKYDSHGDCRACRGDRFVLKTMVLYENQKWEDEQRWSDITNNLRRLKNDLGTLDNPHLGHTDSRFPHRLVCLCGVSCSTVRTLYGVP